MIDKYIVITDHGSVLVKVNMDRQNALETDLLSFERPTPENSRDVTMEVPLKAFGAKMVEIIQTIGVGDFAASPKMVEMMVREKATSDLNRIARWAKDNL